MLNLSSDDDEPITVVDELCETAIRCADIEEFRGVAELGDPNYSASLLETFHELEKRHGAAEQIPEIERLLHSSEKAEPAFVSGIYATIAALEKAKAEDALDDRVRAERAAADDSD